MTGLKSNLKLGIKIGGGHFGDVFKAKDDVHGDVAVKVLSQRPGEPDIDWNLRKEGLLTEGQRLSQAAHQNVVRVHHLLRDETADTIHLVMKLAEGGSLQTAFDKGPMRLADVLKAASEVALGLQSLHARGMLHRDIKPGNVLLTADHIAQLGDFGLVTDNLILGYGSQAGYADHISPEVWNGKGTSIKSDIWALGMTIYRLLHGANWYSRLPADPRIIIPHGGFSASLPWLPHIPDHWRRVIRKMMHDDTQQRYQNANHVKLSCEPNWECAVSTAETSWTRTARERRFNVVWRRLSPREYKWLAWSEPLGTGNRRTLGGSGGLVSCSKSERQLKTFFAN